LPAHECNLLHEWLRSTARERPHAPAIEEDGRITTFDQLHGQAEALALQFIAHGLRPGDRVALLLPKTTGAVVAVFASLLAGAAYVPIHPRWPQERVQAVLRDCAARLLIEEENGARRITDLETGALLPDPLPGGDPEPWPLLDPAATAVLLFTSGSTGVPKGVVLSHRAVAAFVRWTAAEFHIGSSDRIACPAPLGFDLSTFDLFNMALAGATAVLVPENIAWMPRFLARFVREARIACWYSVPSILIAMLEEGRFAESAYPDLRLILFAGEVFAPPALVRLMAAVPDAQCANLYGPTETNVVTWFPVPRAFKQDDPLPIGRPCPYAETVVDPASGELLAGGASLMDGYWNRPEETARAFTVVDGHRYYRTGDCVSVAPDGNYLFHGRLDRQIKRRGFRIELGEIEAALLRHPQVIEAAAVAANDPTAGTRIVAFVRLRSSEALALAEIRAHCARLLAPYMLPDRFILTDILVKGSRGKIDYAALARAAEGNVRGD
jgi:amino acid adenylation domain-containing protein